MLRLSKLPYVTTLLHVSGSPQVLFQSLNILSGLLISAVKLKCAQKDTQSLNRLVALIQRNTQVIVCSAREREKCHCPLEISKCLRQVAHSEMHLPSLVKCFPITAVETYRSAFVCARMNSERLWRYLCLFV